MIEHDYYLVLDVSNTLYIFCISYSKVEHKILQEQVTESRIIEVEKGIDHLYLIVDESGVFHFFEILNSCKINLKYKKKPVKYFPGLEIALKIILSK